MKSLMTFIGVMIAFAAIVAVFFGGYLAISYVWQVYADLDATLRLILLSSFAVFLVGCFVLAGAIKLSAQLKNKGHLAEAKIALYKTMLDLYESYLSVSQAATAQSQNDLQIKLGELHAAMTLVADSSVIEAHRKLVAAVGNREDNDKLQPLYQQMISIMRQDLGHGKTIEEARLRFAVTSANAAHSSSAGHGVSA